MRPVARPRIEQAAFGLLDASRLCAISTVSPRTTAHVHTAYFVWSRDFEILWLSDPAATHSRNLRVRPSTAITVFDSHQVWGQSDRGIQLFGSTRELPATEIAHAESLYAARFPGYSKPDLRAYRFYRFRTERLKVFDEAMFGAGAFVTATIHSGQRLTWERTDIFSGAEANENRPLHHSERGRPTARDSDSM
jgi:uncharacterized protein YhbP (UPF0306 family)